MSTLSEQTPSTSAISELSARFTRYLESNRHRKTPERFAILSRAVSMPEHFGGDDLFSIMEREGYHVSRSTVYNTLDLLCECGILVRHRFGTRAARYEVAMQNHCHLICLRCGRVDETRSPDFGNVLPLMDSGGFRPSYYSTSVYGLCSDCLSEEQNSDTLTEEKIRNQQ